MEDELQAWYESHKQLMGEYQTKDLASYLKVSPRTIQRWVKQKTQPSKEMLGQIKKYMASIQAT